MALKFGELWGELRVDDSQIKPGVARAVDQGKREMDQLERHGDVVGRETGESVSSGTEQGMDGIGTGMAGKMDAAKGALLGAAAGLAAAAGAIFASQFAAAMDIEKGTDRLAAGLNLTEEQSAIAGEVAGSLFADAYGENMEQVTDAVDAVGSTLTDVTDANQDDLEDLSAKALDLANTFGFDVAQTVNTVGTSIRHGLADDAEHGFDLIARAMQSMPAHMRDEIFPAIDEYGDELAAMGFTGEQAFGLLAEASRDGMFGIDKTGDAIKELGIRATDMSETSVSAFEAAGLNAQDMSDRFLAGGDTARGALDDLIEGLLGMDDPVARSNAAIALFGTPLEDLGVTEIPDFLESLSNMESSLGDVDGAAKDLGTTLNDNTATETEQFKRSIQTNITDFINDSAIPAIRSFPENTSVVWDEMKRQWDGGSAELDGAWGGAIAGMRTTWEAIGLGSVTQGTWNFIESSTSDSMSTVQSLMGAGGDILSGNWSGAWGNIQSAAGSAWSQMQTNAGYAFNGLKEVIGGALGAVWNIIRTVFLSSLALIGSIPRRIFGIAAGMFRPIGTFASRAVNTAMMWVGALPSKLLGVVGRVGGAAGAIGRAIMDNIGRGIGQATGFIGDVGAKMWNAIRGWLNRNFIDRVRGFGVNVLGADIRPFSGLPRLHTGGRVPGPAGMEVPAVLMAGETVRTIEQERGLMDAIAALSDAAVAGIGGRGAITADMGDLAGTGARGGRGRTTIGTLQVVSNDPPRRWLDEGLWRVAG